MKRKMPDLAPYLAALDRSKGKLLAETVRAAIASFQNDPPDSPYQWGYLDALIIMVEDGLMTGAERAKLRKRQPTEISYGHRDILSS